MRKMLPLITLFAFLSIVSFAGDFSLFDNTVIINNSPIFILLGDGYSIGLSYSTVTIYYSDVKVGFLNIKKPSMNEKLNFSFFVGTNPGVYLSIGYENLNFPSSSKELTFFVSKEYSFFSSNSKSFFAIGPISLNSESCFLRKRDDFGYSLNRNFVKYNNFSFYFLLLNNVNFIGYLYPLDNSLEQGVIGGIGTDWSDLYLNAGIRKYINLGDIRGFMFGYFYSGVNSIFDVRYLLGYKMIVPLKGEIIVWDGKISFGLNW